LAELIGQPSERDVPGLGLEREAQDLRRRARAVEQGIFNVLVLGEFKNGKSTLLNALLGSRVLPAKATPATAIITVLVHGDADDVAIYSLDSAEPRRVSRADFLQEMQLTEADLETLERQHVADRFRDIAYVQLECQLTLCANGVRLIDSPGLGEQASRTRVTTDFLRQAQAVIFVLSATRILSEDERRYIDTYLGHDPSSVFFVVNRINQVDEQAVDEIKAWVQRTLGGRFHEADGTVDEDQYRRRVFFVNARGALDARTRMEGQERDEALAESGVPALEQELERFLASDEKLNAALATDVLAAQQAAATARERVELALQSLDQPLADLEAEQQATTEVLAELQREQARIPDVVAQYAETIKRKVYASLRDYVEEMQRTWPQDAGIGHGFTREATPRIVSLDEVSPTDMLASAVDVAARQRIADAVQGQIDHYLRVKLDGWVERVPVLIQPDVNALVNCLGRQAEDVQVRLESVRSAFASGGHTSGGVLLDDSGQDHAAMGLQALVGLALLDPRLVGGSLVEKGDWSAFLGRLVQQVVLRVVVLNLFTGGMALPIFLLLDGILLWREIDQFRERLLAEVGTRLFDALRSMVGEAQAPIYAEIDARFREVADTVAEALGRQVAGVAEEQAAIVQRRRELGLSTDGERARLAALGREIDQLAAGLATA
jgi:hypothetical protein